MSTRIGTLGALLAAIGGSAFFLQAEDWPCWRGPRHDGISRETNWVSQWPADGPPIAWKTKVGLGFSTFVVSGGHAVTTGHADDQDTVWCLDAETGKPIWKHSFAADLGDKFFEGGTTGTPTLDGDRVYSLNRWGEVFCFESATGKVVWTKNIATETGIRVPGWGFGGAPLVHENIVLLNVGEAGVALDKSTGALLWKSANKDAGYSTPLPFRKQGEWFAAFGSEKSYLAVNLKTGKEAWRIRWLTQYGVNATDPILDGDDVFVSTGYGKGSGRFHLGEGEPQPVWKSRTFHTQMNSAVRIGGFLYGVDGDSTERGSLKCLDWATGEEKWAFPDIGPGSVTAAGDRLLVMNDRGELMTGPASSDGFKPTARAQVLGGKCWIVPVLANGRLYCRNARGDVVVLDLRSR
jgi:outer membrane protein assembly factor BamB